MQVYGPNNKADIHNQQDLQAAFDDIFFQYQVDMTLLALVNPPPPHFQDSPFFTPADMTQHGSGIAPGSLHCKLQC